MGMGRNLVVLTAAALVVATVLGRTASAAGSGNPRNDRLLALPEPQVAAALGNSFHRGCVGVEAFPMGVTATGRAKGYAYWSVRCQNGKSYAVQIPRNVKTPITVVDCQALQGTGHECFKKF
jgi:ribosomal protein S28E/S33